MNTVVGIYLCPEKGQPMQWVAQVTALAGRGLEGDRYALDQGRYSKVPNQSDKTNTFPTSPSFPKPILSWLIERWPWHRASRLHSPNEKAGRPGAPSAP